MAQAVIAPAHQTTGRNNSHTQKSERLHATSAGFAPSSLFRLLALRLLVRLPYEKNPHRERWQDSAHSPNACESVRHHR